MATKPTDPIDWAESGTATDPASKRTNGWLDNDLLPAAEANFLWQALGRWATFAGAMFGNTGDLTQDVADGSLVATTDGATRELDHTGTATTLITSDIVRGRGEVRVGQTGVDALGVIISEDVSGAPFNAARMRVDAVNGGLSAGVFSGAMGVTLAQPPTADYATAFPRISSLYTRNTAKLVCVCNFAWDAGGAISTVGTEAGEHNVASSALNTATTPDQFEVTPTEDFSVGAVQLTIMDGSITSPQFSAAVVRIPGSPDKIAVRLYYFGGGGWNDALAGNIALANVTVNVAVVAY